MSLRAGRPSGQPLSTPATRTCRGGPRVWRSALRLAKMLEASGGFGLEKIQGFGEDVVDFVGWCVFVVIVGI